jgi:hypothetical protein
MFGVLSGYKKEIRFSECRGQIKFTIGGCESREFNLE